MTIDLDNINRRVQALPVEAGNYRLIGAVEEGLLFSTGNKIARYHIKEEKIEDILNGANNGQLAADGKSFIYRTGSNYAIAKNQPGQKVGENTLNLEHLTMKIDPREEWNQIYADAFRIFRDYFYVDNLHGVDWTTKVTANCCHMPSRFDLDYILNEVVSETNTGHAYVDWRYRASGRVEGDSRRGTGSRPPAGRYKIRKIYAGENWNQSRRSPLTEMGVDVKEGDFILAINGQELTTDQNPYELLENRIGISSSR